MSAIALLKKRQNGQYYTEGNPFILKPFQSWIEKHKLQDKSVLEPFAGANNIIHSLQQVGMASKFSSFDINPTHPKVTLRDTLSDFPQGFELCVTNPPWLAKNSAKRRGLAYPETPFDDLYKHALDLCVKNCNYVAAIIPATFLRSGELRNNSKANLETIVFLHDQNGQSMFLDTENPVCLALFSPEKNRISIFNDNEHVGFLDELEMKLPEKAHHISLTFNHPNGNLGFIAIDNNHQPSIRFVKGEELAAYEMKFTSRMITRIDCQIKNIDKLIQSLNEDLANFRNETKDVFLTPFKGLRKDGAYRRRMDYSLAKDFIAKHANTSTRF